MAQKQVSVRLAVVDGNRMKAEFADVGDTGQEAMERIERSTVPAGRGLQAVGTVTESVRGQVDELAGRAGVLGRALMALGPVGLGLAAGAGGAVALGEGLRRVSRDIAAMAAEAERAGVGVELFQELSFAAEQLNVRTDALTDSMRELQLRADEFVETGSGTAAEAFERLGLSRADLRERLQDPADLLVEITRRVEDLDKAAQIRIFDEIFGGTGGEQLVAIASKGADELERAIEMARDLGVALDDEMVERAVEIDREFDKISTLLEVRMKEGVIGVAESTLQLLGYIQDVRKEVKSITELLPEIPDWFPSGSNIFEAAQILPKLVSGVPDQAPTEITVGPNDETPPPPMPRGRPYRFSVEPPMPQVDPRRDLTSDYGLERGGGAAGAAERADAFERAREAIERQTAALRLDARAVGMSADAAERMRAVQDLENAAREAGIPITEEYRAQIEKLAGGLGTAAQAYEEARERARDLEEAQDFFGDSALRVFEGLTQGAEGFKGAMLDVASAIQRAALEAVILGQGPLAGLFGMQEGGLFGALTDGLLGSGGGKTSAWLYHDGGVVGAPGARQVMDLEAMYQGAAKYHSGLKPNEYRAILEEGERILTERDSDRTVETLRGLTRQASEPGVTVNMPAIVINAEGADREGLARLEAKVEQLRREMPSMAVSAVKRAKGRGDDVLRR